MKLTLYCLCLFVLFGAIRCWVFPSSRTSRIPIRIPSIPQVRIPSIIPQVRIIRISRTSRTTRRQANSTSSTLRPASGTTAPGFINVPTKMTTSYNCMMAMVACQSDIKSASKPSCDCLTQHGCTDISSVQQNGQTLCTGKGSSANGVSESSSVNGVSIVATCILFISMFLLTVV